MPSLDLTLLGKISEDGLNTLNAACPLNQVRISYRRLECGFSKVIATNAL